jgi:hypothetical protein
VELVGATIVIAPEFAVVPVEAVALLVDEPLVEPLVESMTAGEVEEDWARSGPVGDSTNLAAVRRGVVSNVSDASVPPVWSRSWETVELADMNSRGSRGSK